MRPEKEQECKWKSGLYGIIIIIDYYLLCLLCYSCKELSHSFQMQAAVIPLLIRKQRFRVHFDPLALD